MDSQWDEVEKETIVLCDTMEGVAREAWGLLTRLDELADALTGEVETAVADLTGRMKTLVTDSVGAKDRIEGGVTSVEGGLERLLQAVGGSVREHQEDAERVAAAAGKTGALRNEPAVALGQLLPRIDNGIAGVDSAVLHLSQFLEGEHEAVVASLTEAAAQVQSGLEAMHTSEAKWGERLDALTIEAGKDVGALVAQLAAVASAHASGTVETLNGVVPAHNAFAEQLARVLGAGLATGLEPSLKDLRKEQTDLATAIEEHTKKVQAAVDEIAKDATAVAAELAGVRQALDALAGPGGR